MLGAAPGAQAVATLGYSVDGAAPIFCADGDACDLNAAAGVVTWSFAEGDFTVNVTTGITKPVFPSGDPLMDLNSVNIDTVAGGGAHTLVLAFSDVDFDIDGAFSALFGGTLSGEGATIDSGVFADAGNALFGGSEVCGIGPFGAGAFSGSCSGGDAPDGLYSVTAVLFLTTNGLANFSGDFEVSVVPEPGTLALLGVGLGLFGFAMRRRQQVS